MNLGTKLRAGLAIVVYLLAVLSIFGICFGSIVGKVCVSVLLAAGIGIVYWNNNDWTEAACQGTGVTRQIKREKKDGYIGDSFYQLEEDENIAMMYEQEEEDE